MTREEAKKILKRIVDTSNELTHPVILNTEMDAIKVAIEALKAQATLDDVSNAYENGYRQGKFEAQQWIPCNSKLPTENEPVNIAWRNTEPEPYYADIKNRCFTATGIYFRGQWYWYSAYCRDMLAEYGDYEADKMDKAIVVDAWMPLPEPYVPDTNVGKKG